MMGEREREGRFLMREWFEETCSEARAVTPPPGGWGDSVCPIQGSFGEEEKVNLTFLVVFINNKKNWHLNFYRLLICKNTF